WFWRFAALPGHFAPIPFRSFPFEVYHGIEVRSYVGAFGLRGTAGPVFADLRFSTRRLSDEDVDPRYGTVPRDSPVPPFGPRAGDRERCRYQRRWRSPRSGEHYYRRTEPRGPKPRGW